MLPLFGVDLLSRPNRIVAFRLSLGFSRSHLHCLQSFGCSHTRDSTRQPLVRPLDLRNKGSPYFDDRALLFGVHSSG